MPAKEAVVIGAEPDLVARCHIAGGCRSVERLTFGHYAFLRGVSVLKNAPHKEATQVCINWLLSREGQETYVREWAKSNAAGALSLRKDVEAYPGHGDAAPDYDRMGDYLLAGADSGEQQLSAVIRLYTEIKNRSR